MNLINSIKNFLGFYNINDFEKKIISSVEKKLTGSNLEAWQDQFRRFNRVERVLENDDRVKCGSTSFYWIKSGKSQLEFPKKFKFKHSEEKLAELEIENGTNEIKIIFQIVDGAFFRIEYYSESRIFQPKGSYKIKSVIVYK